MTHSRIATVFAFTTFAATSLLAGTTGAEPNKDEFCKETGFYTSRDFSPADFANLSASESDATSVAAQFGNMICTRGKVTDRDKIMALRTSWMRAAGIDERDFLVIAARSKGRTYQRQDETKIAGPLSQLSNSSAAQGLVELDQLAGAASMFSRFVVVERCLAEAAERMPLLRHILCTREQLDTAKALAEIDSVAELNNGTRYRLRTLVKSTAVTAAKARAEITAKAKADPAIAKVIEIAEAQFKDWAATTAARAKLTAQLAAMEAATKANKSSGFAGCEAPTRASWEQQLQGAKLPKVPSESALPTFISATLTSAEAYLAYAALQLCSAGTGSPGKSDVLGSDVIRRGPRTATVAAWLAAESEIKFDDRALSMRSLLANGNLPMSPAAGAHDRQLQGVIADLAESERDVEITFKRVVEPREDCLKWRETSRIVTFRADGSPLYHRECLKWGVVKMDLTASPITISKALAHGLKKGMYLVGIDGLAIVATSGAKSMKPIWVLGGAVR
jgi:hypothetical protein